MAQPDFDYRLMTLLSERGVQEILVGTTVENTAARRTYEKAGMRPIAFRTGTKYRYPPATPLQNG